MGKLELTYDKSNNKNKKENFIFQNDIVKNDEIIKDVIYLQYILKKKNLISVSID